MGSVAQTLGGRSGLWSSQRTTAVLRHLALRGAAVVYLGLLVALPVLAVITKGFGDGLGTFRDAMATPAAWAAIRLTLWTSTVAAGLNAVMGTLLAWVLVRYRFPGRRLLSTLIDLPLAIPTLVTGVMILALYGPNSVFGRFLDDLGIRILFTPIAIVIALCTVTLPLVVRNVQPVLQELDTAEEEAAATLGAGPRTTFRRVVFPAIRSAVVAGTLLTFSRCLGEIGSVILVAGNIPKKTLTAPVFIFQLTSQFKPAEAAAVATLLFAISFVLVLVTSRLIARKEAPA
ncbi:MAG: sulfate ABC transporter permease subunit CysT [Actinobacteria bacterium]|nr:MAG: sulfate ABC transporter permease subunit CysT [Actinomycetota bacterium]